MVLDFQASDVSVLVWMCSLSLSCMDIHGDKETKVPVRQCCVWSSGPPGHLKTFAGFSSRGSQVSDN